MSGDIPSILLLPKELEISAFRTLLPKEYKVTKVGERESRAVICGRGAMEKTAGPGKQQSEDTAAQIRWLRNSDTETATPIRRRRNSGTETAAQKQQHRYGCSEKTSQPDRMNGGAAMCGVGVL